MNSWRATSQMTHCVALSLNLLLLLVMVGHERPADAADVCHIHAMLFVTPTEQRTNQDFGLPLDIDCSNSSSVNGGAAFDFKSQRVAGMLHVRLIGSETPPLGVASYGLEYLDNCPHLLSLEIERFVGVASLALSCAGGQLKSMRSVALQYNELSTLSGNSFALLPHLKHLILENNSLRQLETLNGCEELQQLTIKRERQLVLRDVRVLANLLQLQRLELTQLKLINAVFLAALPGALTEMQVQQTTIEPSQLRMDKGSDQLVNLTIVQCELQSFTLYPSTVSKLVRLNLSGNALGQLDVVSSSLISLDLSENRLSTLNSGWFAQMPHLQLLHLQANRLHSISVLQLLKLAPHSLVQLNLSANQLMYLDDSEIAELDQAQQLRIQIDDNPWSCQWLLNFSHAQPQLFRLFLYAKYISQINVNGLSCRPQLEHQSMASFNKSQPHDKGSATRYDHFNVSSHMVLYGNPVQLPHSQRSEAIIIVFMLPLGIALLFLLLYLYLHCERLFHWSYYTNELGCFGGNKSERSHCFVDHVDVVRYPIANNVGIESETLPDDYETPLSGSASICNCVGHRQSLCSKTHHVTYETMPTELPFQLYAEIRDQADSDAVHKTLAETAGSTDPIYDHLSFNEQPQDG